MGTEELETLVMRQLRPTDRQWEDIRVIAGSLGIACNGRGCVNYKLDVALACVLKLRKEREMANNKRQPEYRLKKRWQERGFVLSGSREVINGKTFTQAHARRIVAMGLADKYLEVVESWNRSDNAVAAVTTNDTDADVVEVTESLPVDGDGDGADTTTTVRKSRRKRKKATEEETTADED